MKRWSDLVRNPWMLAPMAGYTDAPFRKLCSRFGAGLTVTEMVSAKALTLGNRNTLALLQKLPEEGPCAVQLFGSDPQIFREAVRHEAVQKFDSIDLNMGCPVQKVFRNGEGSALMQTPEKAARIVEAVKSATEKPVSVKFRLGVDASRENCVEFGIACAEAGADALTVHGRTRTQMYSGKASFEKVAQLVQAVRIPVYANGDVTSLQEARLLQQRTGAYGVAVGRGALGRPWLFREASEPPEVWPLLKEQMEDSLALFGEHYALNALKRHAAFYCKGIPGGKKQLVRLYACKTLEDGLRELQEFWRVK